MVTNSRGLVFPDLADGIAAAKAGHAAAMAAGPKLPPHAATPFVEGCLRSSWLTGYNRGRQELLQARYGEAATA